jgi:hypothetical protein
MRVHDLLIPNLGQPRLEEPDRAGRRIDNIPVHLYSHFPGRSVERERSADGHSPRG